MNSKIPIKIKKNKKNLIFQNSFIKVIIYIKSSDKKPKKKDEIINFKSKSISARTNPNLYEDNEKRDNGNLIEKFKLQFDGTKIKNIERPDKLEHFINDKFIREKNGMTKKLEELNRVICKF